MDEKEKEEILYRIDERTEKIQQDISRVEMKQRKQDKKIDDLEAKTQKNTTNIKVGKAIMGVIGTAVAGVFAKIGGIFAA